MKTCELAEKFMDHMLNNAVIEAELLTDKDVSKVGPVTASIYVGNYRNIERALCIEAEFQNARPFGFKVRHHEVSVYGEKR